jgi:acyl dehydratase
MPKYALMEHVTVGTMFTSEYTFTKERIDIFNHASDEKNPLHADREFAAKQPWKVLSVSGLHLWKPVTQLFHNEFAPQFIADEHGAKFPYPMYEGGTGYIEMSCTERKCENGIMLSVVIRKQRMRPVLEGFIFARSVPRLV